MDWGFAGFAGGKKEAILCVFGRFHLLRLIPFPSGEFVQFAPGEFCVL